MLTTTTRPDHRSIGEILAGKLAAAKRRPQHSRPRPRAKRLPRRPTPQAELERTPLGREASRLLGQLAEARTAETLTKAGLEAVEGIEATLRERICEAEAKRTSEGIRQAEALRMRHFDAEAEVRTWRTELAKHRGARERLQAELSLLAPFVQP